MTINSTISLLHLIIFAVSIGGSIIAFWFNTKTKIMMLEREVADLKSDGEETSRKLDSILEKISAIALELKEKANRRD